MSDREEIVDADPMAIVAYTPDGIGISAAMAQALGKLGVKTTDISTTDVPIFWKLKWEDICTIHTKDPKTLVSPLMTVTSITVFPEDTKEYDDYVGFVRIEAVTEVGEHVSMSHAYTYRESGELLPLAEYLTKKVPPFLLRVGYVETRKTDRHVVKPFPNDMAL